MNANVQNENAAVVQSTRQKNEPFEIGTTRGTEEPVIKNVQQILGDIYSAHDSRIQTRTFMLKEY